MELYLNRICPLVNRKNQGVGGAPWECRELRCRFQLEGVCAIIGALVEARENRRLLDEICHRLGISQ